MKKDKRLTNVPTGWNEVNVKMFEEILAVEEKKELFQTPTEYGLNILSIITKIPYDMLLKATAEQFTEINGKLDWTSKPPVPSRKNEYLIKGKKYLALTNLNQLTFGEVIDAEIIIKDFPSSKLLSKLLPILVRQAVTKDRKLVPSDFDATNYQANVKLLSENLMITDVLHLQDFF